MDQARQQPSLVRIIQSDYLALLSVVVPVVMWVLYLAGEYFGFLPGFRGREPNPGARAPFFLYLAIILLSGNLRRLGGWLGSRRPALAEPALG